VARFAIKPGPETGPRLFEPPFDELRKPPAKLYQPLDLVGRLGDEKTLGARLDFHPARVDRDFAVDAVLALDLDRQQQQLQLGETQPAERHNVRTAFHSVPEHFFGSKISSQTFFAILD